MAFELKEKQEQYNKVVKDIQEIAVTVKAEQRAFSSDEKLKVERMQGEEKALRAEIDTLQSLAGIDSLQDVEKELRSAKPEERVTKRMAQPKDYDLALRGWMLQQSNLPVDEVYRDAAARADVNLSSHGFEIRQQSTTAAEGGHLKRPQDLGNIIEILDSQKGMREVSTVIPRAKGNELKYPTLDDTANVAGIVSELASFTNTSMVFGEVKLNVVGLRSAVFPVSVEILQDSEFPLQTVINNALTKRLGRAINQLATSSTTFKGVINGLTANAYEYTELGLEYTDLVKMQEALATVYGDNARWMFTPAVLSEIQLMVDDNGQPLWRPDLIGGVPGTIMGKPYTINESMADADTILYGDFAEGYQMLEVGKPELITLNELYRVSNNAIGVCIFHRMGGGVVNPAAIKMFNRASS